MMAYIIQCIEPIVNYRGNEVQNYPVNLDKVAYIAKVKYSHYPDNEGMPSIQFSFDGNYNISWVYSTEERRDYQYAHITTIQN